MSDRSESSSKFSSGSDEEVDETISKPKRKGPIPRSWIESQVFETAKLAMNYVESSTKWKRKSKSDTTLGQKIFYRCSLGEYRKKECPAMLYLLFHAENSTVTLYRTVDGHENHVDGRRLSSDAKKMARRMYGEGFRTVTAIIAEFRKRGLKKPDKFKLKDFLIKLRNGEVEPLGETPDVDVHRTRKISILRMTCQKLKSEMDNINLHKEILLQERQNKILHIQILKVKIEHLTNEVNEMKKAIDASNLLRFSKNEEQSINVTKKSTRLQEELNKKVVNYKTDNSKKEVAKNKTDDIQKEVTKNKTDNIQKEVVNNKTDDIQKEVINNKNDIQKEVVNNKTDNIQKEVVNNKTEDIQKEVFNNKSNCIQKEVVNNKTNCIQKEVTSSKTDDLQKRSPFILLMPRISETQGVNKNKKFFIKKIYDTDINQHFELISEDPFQILPLDRDIIIKSDHLNAIKQIVIAAFSHASSIPNSIPYVSLTRANPLTNATKLNPPKTHNMLKELLTEIKEENLNSAKNVIDLTDSQDDLKSNNSTVKSNVTTKIGEATTRNNKRKISGSFLNNSNIKLKFTSRTSTTVTLDNTKSTLADVANCDSKNVDKQIPIDACVDFNEGVIEIN